MKIPFTLGAWLKDKSQKVETRDGRLVHNIWRVKEPSYTNNRKTEVCALIDGEEDALVFFEGGRYLPTTQDTDNPFDLFLVTPELELSEFEERIFKLLRQYKECDIPLTPENIKADASMLWMDFEKHFFNLYGREGEGDSALRSFYYKGLADGKAEALKDLPRWKIAKEYIKLGPDDFCFTLDDNGKTSPYWATEVEKGQYYITESDIENLPKED